MAGSLNEVQLIGNLGRDPEIKTFSNGNSIANLRIATTDSWKDKESGDRKERTEWHSVVIGGPLVKVAEKYLKKGTRIFVRGKLTTRKWKDSEGADRYTTEVTVQGFAAQLIILTEKGARNTGGASDADDASSSSSSSSGGASAPSRGGDDDDMPF